MLYKNMRQDWGGESVPLPGFLKKVQETESRPVPKRID